MDGIGIVPQSLPLNVRHTGAHGEGIGNTLGREGPDRQSKALYLSAQGNTILYFVIAQQEMWGTSPQLDGTDAQSLLCSQKILEGIQPILQVYPCQLFPVQL